MPEYNVYQAHELAQVSQSLKAHGVLAYPSESVWGLGCDAFDEVALERIISLKSRDIGKGLIVLTDTHEKLRPLFGELPTDISQRYLHELATLDDTAMITAKQATTWLIPVPKQANLPKVLTGEFDTLAVRITPHPVLKALCQELTTDDNPYGFLVSTSCNPSGQAPAQSLAQAQAYFGRQVDYLDVHSLNFSKPSQIIDLQTHQIIR